MVALRMQDWDADEVECYSQYSDTARLQRNRLTRAGSSRLSKSSAPASSPPAEWPCRRSNAPSESNRTLKLNYGIIPGRRSPTQPGIFYV